MKWIESLLLMPLAFTSFSCGKNSEDKTASSGETSVTTDNEAAHATIATSADDAVEAIVEDAASSASLAESGKTASATRTCEANATDGSATVTTTHTLDGSLTKKVGVNEFTVTAKADGKETRVWKKATAGSAITCKNDRAAIKWADNAEVDGLKLDINLNFSNSLKTTHKNTKKNTEKTKTRAAKVEGSRSITWAATGNTENGTITRTRTLTSSVKRTITFTNKEAKETTLESTVTTCATSPLVSEVVRDSTTFAWKTKTIKTGCLESKDKAGNITKTTFEALKFDKTAPCLPVSGSITAEVFASGSTTAASKYTITFDSETAYISKDSGEKTEFVDWNGQKCALADES